MAEAILLGTGTSTGVPIIGKPYPDGYLDEPKNWRRRCALLLKGPTGNVLVDAGPDIRMQLLDAQVDQIEAAIITHTHADHIMGMDDLRAFCLRTREPVTVYSDRSHQEDIRRVFRYAFEDFPPGIFVPRFNLLDVPETLELGGMSIQTFWVEHGPVSVLGLRVGGFAYLTDVGHIPDGARKHLESLDDLVLDAVRRRPHPNHFHLEKALEEAASIGAKRTWLTHLSDDFDWRTDRSDLPAGIDLAHDGQAIRIS